MQRPLANRTLHVSDQLLRFLYLKQRYKFLVQPFTYLTILSLHFHLYPFTSKVLFIVHFTLFETKSAQTGFFSTCSSTPRAALYPADSDSPSCDSSCVREGVRPTEDLGAAVVCRGEWSESRGKRLLQG